MERLPLNPDPPPGAHARLSRQGGIRRVLPTLFASLLLAASRATAAPVITPTSLFYVDNTNPNASAAGPGSLGKPYRTIGDALNAHPDSGVTVVVRPGIYRERVVVPASGTAAHPVLIRADGAVTVDGADDLALPEMWSPFSGDVWVAPGVSWQPLQAFADGARLLPSTQSPEAVEPGRFRWVTGLGLYVNVGGGSPASHGVAAGRRTHGFLLVGRSHVVIDGFHITRTEVKGVEAIDGSRVIIRRNVVDLSASGGIAVDHSSEAQIFGNTVSDNNHHGIEFRSAVTNSLIDGNESFANAHLGSPWATGIYLANSAGNVIECNRLHDNQDSGCEIQSGSNDNLVRQNVSWSNGDHGFAQLFATGTLLMNNVAWGNHTEGFSVEGASTGTRLYNCISLNRALAPGSYCVFVDSSSTAGFDADYNVYWNVADQPPIRFGNAVYPNVAAFQSATGIGPNSFGADPRFVDAAQGDFHLRGDSPAIDAATTAIPSWEETDAEGHMRTDAPETPNTGAGPVGFADRGALEYLDGVLAVGEGRDGPALALSAAWPNPSRRGVSFTLQLPAAADVSWSVFDVQGRELWGGHAFEPAGRSELHWGLTDRDGSRVPNGVYLARVRRGGDAAMLRFVVMQ